jgi:3-hydroxyisobutyrate dehydrogenase-like beta-hydroxyacid dehydrogenase
VASDLAAELGATVVEDVAAAVEAAPIVLSVLANGPVTEAALTAPDVLAASTSDTIVVDMGTSGVATAQRLAATITGAGAAFVDGPVSGSVATVEAGQLLVMASGDEAAIDRVEPVLGAFSKRVARLGDPGNGQAMKLAVNLVVHGLNTVLSEALALADTAGVDRARAYDVLQDSVVASPFVDYKRAAFLEEDDAVAFTLALVGKDLGLIRDLAASLGVPVRATDAAAQSVAGAVERGRGDQDMARLCADILDQVGVDD